MSTPSPEFCKLFGLDGNAAAAPPILPIDKNADENAAGAVAMPPPFKPTNPAMLNNEASYVTRYTSAFKIGFDTGTAILWDILFSDSIGGNFDPKTEDFIYVTAWNRASLGCEALVAYYHSAAPGLAVYDHKSGQYVTLPPGPMTGFKPYAMPLFERYVRTQTVGSYNLRAITIANMTYEDHGGWTNEVYLQGAGLPPCNLYKSASPYQATGADQKTNFPFDGSYGPTIEPSRRITQKFSGTNPIGWSNARLANRDSNGTWSGWQLLSRDRSRIEAGYGGFKARYAEANYAAVLTT
jgi:hypothetical protein